MATDSGDSLGDRMKAYEACATFMLPRRSPLIVRVDGRAFHTLTRNMAAFDKKFHGAMVSATCHTAVEMHGFVLAYTQSDEASFFLQDWRLLGTESWFGKNLSKVVSIAAATMSVAFSRSLGVDGIFDARAFVLPPEEVSNYFLWRCKDYARNSIQMYGREFLSHKQMHELGHSEIHEELHKLGKNWTTDLDPWMRNGTFVRSVSGGWSEDDAIMPKFDAVDSMVKVSIEAALSDDMTPGGSATGEG